MYRERAQSYTEKIFMFFVLEILLHYDTPSFFIIASPDKSGQVVVLRALSRYIGTGCVSVVFVQFDYC